jgi:hypothetical protein
VRTPVVPDENINVLSGKRTVSASRVRATKSDGGILSGVQTNVWTLSPSGGGRARRA